MTTGLLKVNGPSHDMLRQLAHRRPMSLEALRRQCGSPSRVKFLYRLRALVHNKLVSWHGDGGRVQLTDDGAQALATLNAGAVVPITTPERIDANG